MDIPLSTRQWAARPPFKSPMPITAPTMAWELETGTNGMAGSPWPVSNRLIPWEEKRNINRPLE